MSPHRVTVSNSAVERHPETSGERHSAHHEGPLVEATLGRRQVQQRRDQHSGFGQRLKPRQRGGVFVVLGAGLVAACIVAIVEFVWKSRKVDSEEREPLCVMFCRELRFAIFCGGSTKPILPKNSPDDRQAPENGLPFMPHRIQ
ncbi:glutamate receptor ionotropic, kainate 2 [Caerostris extrusa]|uniref:Glutamate receptor ionotropic, kainate 2 n=1 Tax=Caerostris extrusa TaxID=172846 RepID=A0AAV4SLB7_CAEEX|nr:glutamate receptor ionotropic, kainate 2 [Caerostris extrusa]